MGWMRRIKKYFFGQISSHFLCLYAHILGLYQFLRLFSENRDKNWPARAIRIFFCLILWQKRILVDQKSVIKLKTTYAQSPLYFSGIYESPRLAKLEMLYHSLTYKERALWAIKSGVFPRIFNRREWKGAKNTVFYQISCHCLSFYAHLAWQNPFFRLYPIVRDKNWTARALRIFWDYFFGKSEYCFIKNLSSC